MPSKKALAPRLNFCSSAASTVTLRKPFYNFVVAGMKHLEHWDVLNLTTKKDKLLPFKDRFMTLLGQKDNWMRVTTPVVLRSSELHDLLSCHHKANGNGIHIPMGNIPKIKSCQGCLARPCACFQYLLDWKVPLREETY